MHGISEAEMYIESHKGLVDSTYRPVYHAAAPCGWINDPNGFCYFAGKYHLFFQYNPYSSVWDSMHWGHWISDDLVRWEWHSVAMAPDMPYDSFGCFSGHAIVKDDTLYLFYTGVRTEKDGSHPQEQCFAQSKDGYLFTKYEGNPVISADDLPDGESVLDFRDPKVYRDGKDYAMLAASCGPNGGDLLKFSSTDLVHWKYVKKHINGMCDMLECPDYFTQNGHTVTVVSTIGMPCDGIKYPGKQPVLGLIDVEKGSPAITVFDNGFDFYAAETTEATDGRRIMIGWMFNGPDDFAPRYLNHNWNNMMTVPRELYTECGKVLQKPARELENYRGAQVSLAGKTIAANIDRVCEISVDVKLNSAEIIIIHTAESENEFFDIEYNTKTCTIRIDRSNAGYLFGKDGSPEEKPYREAHLINRGVLGLRIFMDKSSCEIFSKDGSLVMSTLICPKGTADGFSCSSDDGSAEFNINAWKHKQP